MSEDKLIKTNEEELIETNKQIFARAIALNANYLLEEMIMQHSPPNEMNWSNNLMMKFFILESAKHNKIDLCQFAINRWTLNCRTLNDISMKMLLFRKLLRVAIDINNARLFELANECISKIRNMPCAIREPP